MSDQKENTSKDKRIFHVIYGSYCGECLDDCTRMYKHYLTGRKATFWTDKSDSFFKKNGLKFKTKMSRESQGIGFDLIAKIPKSIFKTTKTNNVFGCPDCNDGCGLYFEYRLNQQNSKPVIYRMEYSSNDAPEDVKKLSELIKSAIEKLEPYR